MSAPWSGGPTRTAATAAVNIIGRRKFFYGLSLAIIVPGLIFLALGGLKPSIEFTGGTQIQVTVRAARDRRRTFRRR